MWSLEFLLYTYGKVALRRAVYALLLYYIVSLTFLSQTVHLQTLQNLQVQIHLESHGILRFCAL